MTTKEMYELYEKLGENGEAAIIAVSYEHPEMTMEEISELLSDAIFEYGDI